MKPTALEKRAIKACDIIRESGSGIFAVEWRKSRNWNFIAVICDTNGDKAAMATGCGYDKESQVISEFLLPLCPSVANTGGCGLSSTKAACAKDGWRLKVLSTSKTYDLYEVTHGI